MASTNLQPKARMGPVGGELEPPPLPRRPPPSLADRHDNHSPKLDNLPTLPPRNGPDRGGGKQTSGTSPVAGQRPHSMWITSSGQSGEEQIPPFPVQTSGGSPHNLLKSTNSNNVAVSQPKEADAKDLFTGHKFDPFEGNSRDWGDPGTFYDVPPPPRKARELESQHSHPSSLSPNTRHKKQLSDPFGESSKQSDNKMSENHQWPQPDLKGYVPPSTSFEPVNMQHKASSQEVGPHHYPSQKSEEHVVNQEQANLSLFPSVDEIEQQILQKHNDSPSPKSARGTAATRSSREDLSGEQQDRERTFSSLFDDPKYIGLDRIPTPSVNQPGGGGEDEDLTGQSEEYSTPLELLHMKSQSEDPATQPSSNSPPPLPERNQLKMTVVSSGLAPPLPERVLNPKSESPTPMPRAQSRTGSSKRDIPPLPPRQNRARSSSPQPEHKSVESDTTKKATLPSSGRRGMQSQENVAQHRSGQQHNTLELLERGYSRDEIQRALAVSGGDLQLAQRILQAFGQCN